MDGSKADKPTKSGVSRRGFLRGVGVVGAGAVLMDNPLLRAADTPAPEVDGSTASAASRTVSLKINGQEKRVAVEPRTTLLSAMRDRLEPPITGPKLVCDIGTCGACTVLIDSKPVYSCLVLAVEVVGKKITTVEGLGTPDKMSPVQQAFVDKDAMMCGFCTPGFVTTVSALLEKNPHPTLEQVKEGCKGNFCKCGTYPHIFEAAMEASKKMA